MKITGPEIQGYIEAQMSRHKWLTAGVYFINAIPRTPSGKVIRRELQKIKTGSTDGSAKL
jgi:4-coumarate--CoA ligase